MRSLLGCWTELAERIRKAGSIVLFADFDGTLAPFTVRPEDARLSRATRAALVHLAAHRRMRVYVISGRGRVDLENRVAAPGVHCLGLHGWDSGAESLSSGTLRLLSQARREVSARLNGTAGVHLEDKGATFALHYRGAGAEATQHARRALEEGLARFRGALAAFPGDCVWEVLPAEIRGKGYAARREWRLRAPNALPIYLGNDGTDEPAFLALSSGITARAGPRAPTHARYFVSGPEDVRLFLEKLQAQIG